MDLKALAQRNYAKRQAMITKLMPMAKEARKDADALYNASKAAKTQSLDIEKFKELKHIPGFFPTPKKLIERILELAELEPGMVCLEPSAGKGNIADALKAAGAQVDCCEINHSLRKILMDKGHTVKAVGDFMELDVLPKYDRILANPPFEDGKDRDHIRRMYDHLLPGGRVVSIMSVGPWQRSFKADVEFKAWARALDCTVEDCDEGAFACAERSTNVRTMIITLDKPE